LDKSTGQKGSAHLFYRFYSIDLENPMQETAWIRRSKRGVV